MKRSEHNFTKPSPRETSTLGSLDRSNPSTRSIQISFKFFFFFIFHFIFIFFFFCVRKHGHRLGKVNAELPSYRGVQDPVAIGARPCRQLR